MTERRQSGEQDRGITLARDSRERTRSLFLRTQSLYASMGASSGVGDDDAGSGATASSSATLPHAVAPGEEGGAGGGGGGEDDAPAIGVGGEWNRGEAAAEEVGAAVGMGREDWLRLSLSLSLSSNDV